MTGPMAWIDERVEEDLPFAARRGELYPVFQPLVGIETGGIEAVEVLCRWQHPELGLLMPDQFIPVAERIGAIDAIGRIMLDECLAIAGRWHVAGRLVEVSLNVSPLQLSGGDFLAAVAREVVGHELPANALTIEITESLPVTDFDGVVLRLADLRELGLGVSLDDYGTGHSSLEQLDRLHATEIKLDRTLMQDAAPGSFGRLTEIVTLAHERGVRVVAEGIETLDQLALAQAVGCDRLQGYLLGMPMPREELEQLLAA